jgi:hypothetical protein
VSTSTSTRPSTTSRPRGALPRPPNAYASYVIDYTLAAAEKAEYAVLDATLAQMEADELAAEMQPS